MERLYHRLDEIAARLAAGMPGHWISLNLADGQELDPAEYAGYRRMPMFGLRGTFPVAENLWRDVAGYAIWDAPEGGNRLADGILDASDIRPWDVATVTISFEPQPAPVCDLGPTPGARAIIEAARDCTRACPEDWTGERCACQDTLDRVAAALLGRMMAD